MFSDESKTDVVTEEATNRTPVNVFVLTSSRTNEKYIDGVYATLTQAQEAMEKRSDDQNVHGDVWEYGIECVPFFEADE